MNTTFVTLTKLIKESSNVIIMSHKNVDIDGFASAVALYQITLAFGKPSYLCFSKKDQVDTVAKAYEQLNKNNLPLTLLSKTIEKYEIDAQTLLIVLDTHKLSLVENENLLELVSRIVVLDHHMKNTDYLKKTTLSYINANVSSTSEIITAYYRYLNKEMHPLFATLLLTGIEVDTHSFTSKTTEATYETAAFLTKMGANATEKQDLLKQDKALFLKRQEEIKNSVMVQDHVSLCVLTGAVYEKLELAKISEEMLQFESVDASFTIGRLSPQVIGISARSTGKIDVEKVMNKLGGGGHIQEAACQLANTTLEEAKTQLLVLLEGTESPQ